MPVERGQFCFHQLTVFNYTTDYQQDDDADKQLTQRQHSVRHWTERNAVAQSYTCTQKLDMSQHL